MLNFHNLAMNELPSAVFAEKPWNGVSDKYAFISTKQVVEALGEVGLVPYMAKQAGTRIEEKRGYTKHMIRFRSATLKVLPGNVYPEVVMINAHDRGSAYILEAGLLRMVCMNGLIVSLGSFGKFRIRHVSSNVQDVLMAADAVLDTFPMIETKVSAMQAIHLSQSERLEFASQAMGLRWNAETCPFRPETLLDVRRRDDIGFDIWSTMNVIQENLIRGQRLNSWGRFATPSGAYRRMRPTQEVRSIDTEVTINKGLWSLAESFIH